MSYSDCPYRSQSHSDNIASFNGWVHEYDSEGRLTACTSGVDRFDCTYYGDGHRTHERRPPTSNWSGDVWSMFAAGQLQLTATLTATVVIVGVTRRPGVSLAVR